MGGPQKNIVITCQTFLQTFESSVKQEGGKNKSSVVELSGYGIKDESLTPRNRMPHEQSVKVLLIFSALFGLHSHTELGHA